MANYCSECTYLNLNSIGDYGNFWCEEKLEWHKANEIECYRFCRAYNRDSSVANSAYNYSIEHTPKEGCYLTTMLCHILGMNDNNIYLETMRSFRKNILQNDEKYKSILVEYDIIGPKIAQYLMLDPLKEKLANTYFQRYIIPISKLLEEKKNNMAINLYMNMTNSLSCLYNLNSITLSIEEINNADIKESGHGIYKTKKLIPGE